MCRESGPDEMNGVKNMLKMRVFLNEPGGKP